MGGSSSSLRFADACAKAGILSFHNISSVGADPKAKSFYLRTKGRLEEALKKYPFKALHSYRPSLLVGQRPEQRRGEDIANRLYHWLQPVFPPFLDPWQPIDAKALARFMLNVAMRTPQGFKVWENGAIHAALRLEAAARESY